MRKKHFYFLLLPLILTAIALWLIIPPKKAAELPVKLSSSGTPVIEIVINDKIYPVVFDLGSKFQFSLNNSVLTSILDKKDNGTAYWRDAKGNHYEGATFLIPKIKLSHLTWENATAREMNRDFEKNTTLWQDDNDQERPGTPTVGTIGRPLIEKTNLFLDFHNSRIVICNEKSSVRTGIPFDKMVKTPCLTSPRGLIVIIETDIGKLRFLIDTGATITLVRSSLISNQPCSIDKHNYEVFTSSKFSIEGRNFGMQDLHKYAITPELDEIDGVLGMDFMMKHIIYLDYPKKMAYFGEACNRSR